MHKAHHVLAVKAAVLAARRLARNPQYAPKGVDIGRVCDFMAWLQADKTASLAKAADDMRDLRAGGGLAGALMERLGNPTCFQHFAYGGTLGDLRGGGRVVRTFDGYCWDCDPFTGLVGKFGDISSTVIRYHTDCRPFDADFLRWSPGARMVTGRQAWDAQKYPSAIDLAEFYAGGFFRYLCRGEGSKAVASLFFAVHLLQDLCVPHHVLCTVAAGHAGYESGALDCWRTLAKNLRKMREKRNLARFCADTAAVLEGDIGAAADARGLGEAAGCETASRLAGRARPPAASKMETWRMTCRAAACTIKLFDMAAAKRALWIGLGMNK